MFDFEKLEVFDFEKLEVYSRLEKLSQEILRFIFSTRTLDPYLKDQLKRSVIGVQLNLAEGTGRVTTADKKHFYAMARSSLFESVAMIQIYKNLDIITPSHFENWYEQMEIISRMLLKLSQNVN
ncbi:MAG TPA: four helix bundle protein [Saprospiraceae bacterium]|nr:four helix bundle protein [Saprospiraceae bacterium]